MVRCCVAHLLLIVRCCVAQGSAVHLGINLSLSCQESEEQWIPVIAATRAAKASGYKIKVTLFNNWSCPVVVVQVAALSSWVSLDLHVSIPALLVSVSLAKYW